MARTISIHEYDLKPGIPPEQLERLLGDAEARGLLRLPGLAAHHFVRGARGARRGACPAMRVYESCEAWERPWGTAEQPRPPEEYLAAWKILGDNSLAPVPADHPDAVRFTAYEEVTVPGVA